MLKRMILLSRACSLSAQVKRAKLPDSLAQMFIIGLDNGGQNSD